MEITYETGARVILEGPCTYEVDSARGGFLSLGKLTARVERSEVRGQGSEEANPKSQILNQQISNPQSLIPNPLFVVRTPTAVVTDLGTEFGVEVEPSGASRASVFRGKVELRVAGVLPSPSWRGAGGGGKAAGDGGGERVIRLRENESARVEAGAGRGVTLTRGTTLASGFPRQMPRRVAIQAFNTGAGLDEGQPDPHWQLVARSDDPSFKPQPALVTAVVLGSRNNGCLISRVSRSGYRRAMTCPMLPTASHTPSAPRLSLRTCSRIRPCSGDGSSRTTT